MTRKLVQFILLFSTVFISLSYSPENKPAIWLIGDSTVDTGSGNNDLWGWGKFLPQFFDTTKISIRNYAQGGASARTFQTNGLWAKNINTRGMWDTVYHHLRSNDYLIIQFGLNDQSAVDDSTRSRGTLKGIGNDSILIFNRVTKKTETIHSFGWYMRQFVVQAKSKGVHVIICSSVPRSIWKEGKIVRGENGFCDWALEVASQEKVGSIDLNTLIADVYDKEGETAVNQKYHFGTDKTHTVTAGSLLNASLVAKGIKDLKNCRLKKYLKK